MYRKFILAFALAAASTTFAQEEKKPSLAEGLQYKVELQSTNSLGDNTPLWLNANKYGLSSLKKSNGYARASLFRPLQTDSGFKWGIGYGVDLAAPYGFTSKFVVQQAFAEGRWWHGVLSIGSKEYPIELKNNELSSGAQTLGRNARPVPQVRIALPEYWTLPFANGWLHVKGHIAYGKMTDDNWQHSFTGQTQRYADDVLYHSKSGFLKIGNEERFFPLSLELGLEMAAQFGGTAYVFDKDGNTTVYKNGTGLKDYWNAFVPGGNDVRENGTAYQNVSGNQLGSWLMRLNYDTENWRFSIYADKFFEDQSSMFQLDYDGYGEGDAWDSHSKRRYLLYDFKDWMLGAELNFKYGTWLRDIVFEYLYTKYQSGAVYHDHSPEISDHIGGRDNFYNHGIFPGWQHWGQVIGNPLYLSPIYNEDGSLYCYNNRFLAFHLGVSGQPLDRLHYRVLATYQKSYGTYDYPYDKICRNFSFLTEAGYAFGGKLSGWNVGAGFAMDFGKDRGNSQGLQVTVSKSGILNFKHSKK